MPKRYNYTNKLKNREYELQEFGVCVNTRAGNVRSWWRAAKKYINDIRISCIQHEFSDFMVATGITDVFIVRDNLNLLQFVVEIDFSAIDEAIKEGRPEFMKERQFFNHLTDLRYDAINDAAYKANVAKAKFQDFIRMHYYGNRMNEAS